VKIFFDENLSFKLPDLLKNRYPDSIHARDAGLRGVTDRIIWNYCKEHGFIIASKDTDFRELSFVKGIRQK